MKTEVEEVTDQKGKETISGEALYALPKWFELPENMEEYITDSQDKPFLVCYTDGGIADYMVLNATSADCADVFVIGVKKELHRMGIGSKLDATHGTMAKELGHTYS